MTGHEVVSQREWRELRADLLEREKEHTRADDELARRRRELPWVAVEKEYRFDTDDGAKTLAGIFDGRSQLLVHHFMFGPSYTAGCPVSSSMADSMDGLLPHLHARDVTLALVSSAPLAMLQAYTRRMGWRIPWASAAGSDFNLDYGGAYPTEAPGVLEEDALPPIVVASARACGTDITGYLSEAAAVSAFTLVDGAVYQTYATAWRGLEFLMPYYPILDRAPRGRDEGNGWQLWLRRHDEYAGRR